MRMAPEESCRWPSLQYRLHRLVCRKKAKYRILPQLSLPPFVALHFLFFYDLQRLGTDSCHARPAEWRDYAIRVTTRVRDRLRVAHDLPGIA